MKKARSAHDILVVERNRADDTFGFGVVFSDATLENFAEATARATSRSRRTFATGTTSTSTTERSARSKGHGFSGMARPAPARHLHGARRAPASGSSSREVRRSAEYAGADLVLAADGVNSMVRRRTPSHFRPQIDWRGNKIVWLAPRFRIRPSRSVQGGEHASWRVHATGTDASMSTFISLEDDRADLAARAPERVLTSTGRPRSGGPASPPVWPRSSRMNGTSTRRTGRRGRARGPCSALLEQEREADTETWWPSQTNCCRASRSGPEVLAYRIADHAVHAVAASHESAPAYSADRRLPLELDPDPSAAQRPLRCRAGGGAHPERPWPFERAFVSVVDVDCRPQWAKFSVICS